MKESGKKLTRGQMVYAPITASQRVSRSPFAQSKRIVISSRPQHHMNSQVRQSPQQSPQQYPKQYRKSPQQSRQSLHSRTQLSPQQGSFRQQQSSIMKNPNSPFNDNQTQIQQLSSQVQQLSSQNSLLKSREDVYVDKLLKLQHGLQRQHEQFMNLQELYTELFNVYKQKEEEIADLELKYKETEKDRVEFNSFSRRDPSFSRRDPAFSRRDQNNSCMSIDKMNSIRNTVVEDNFRNQLTHLIFQNKRLNEINEKLLSELNYLKSKDKLYDSKHTLNNKIIDEINDWQAQLNSQKEEKIKLQYENKFFKLRNQDLQKTITDLQKVISMKQNQIIKMRQDKINFRKQSSEKVLNRSPPKSTLDSARSKSNQDSKKYTKTIENLQKENHRLREENLQLKEKCKSNIFQKSPSRLAQSAYNRLSSTMHGNGQQHFTSIHKKLDFGQTDGKYNQDSLRSYQNENFNSQNTNEQYFSFSRQREERLSEEDLPTFPMDLEIEGIIRKHQEHRKESQTEENAHQEAQIVA